MYPKIFYIKENLKVLVKRIIISKIRIIVWFMIPKRVLSNSSVNCEDEGTDSIHQYMTAIGSV